MRIYLDACCLLRPFDDQSQDRVRLESEAVLSIVHGIRNHSHTLVCSEAVEFEIERGTDPERRVAAMEILNGLHERTALDSAVQSRARELGLQGLDPLDALHLALAERAGCDILLTTDDVLLRRCQRLTPPSAVRVENPAVFAATEFMK